MSLKDSLLKAASDYKPVIEKIESKIGTVYLRSMAGWALSKWQQGNASSKDYPSRGYALAYCLCEADGERWELTESEVLQLDRLDTAVTEPLLDVALRLSGLGKESREEAEKNLNRQSGNSG